MRKMLYKNIIKSRIVILIFLTFTFTNATACSTHDQKFEGYQIKFDYEKYPKEREIAYQYYLNYESQYLRDIKKEEIGIDLFDIDTDGEKEIFLYVNGGNKCPIAGCPFAVLKAVKGEKPYLIIPWARANGRGIAIYSAPLILSSKSVNYSDIGFIGQDKSLVV